MDPSSNVEESTTHDDAFYFDADPMTVFLVENKLFRVHRYFLIQGSEFFRNLFTEAGGGGDGSAAEGRSDEQPIPLPDVTVKEFKTLLRFFYAMAKHTDTMIAVVDLLEFDMDQKLALLSISHRFMFDSISKYMLRVIPLDQLDVLDRIRLGDKYGLSEWLFSGYEHLIERISTRLTKEEIDVLGPDRVVRLLEAKVFLAYSESWNIECENCHYRRKNKPHRNLQCDNCGDKLDYNRKHQETRRCDNCNYVNPRHSTTLSVKDIAMKFLGEPQI